MDHLKDIRLDQQGTEEQHRENLRLQKDYEEQCRRIYEEVRKANESLDGKVAVEWPSPEGQNFLLLRGHHTKKLDQPTVLSGDETYTTFLLGPSQIFSLQIRETDYPQRLSKLSLDERKSRFQPANIEMVPLQEGGLEKLQTAINNSIARATAKQPNINPADLKSIKV